MKKFKLTIFNTPEKRMRIASAVVLAPVVLAAVYYGDVYYAGLITLMITIALYEWLRLVDNDVWFSKRCGIKMAGAASVVLAAAGKPALAVAVIVLATAVFYVLRRKRDPQAALWFAFGLPYLAGSGVALIVLRATPDAGLVLVLYLCAVVWGMDIGAYFAGRRFKGPKLAPRISPGKTWSGFFGGLALALVASAAVLYYGHARSVASGLLLAAVLATAAQMGDLFKSYFKRRAGVKDCGNIIPGHGGVLDRVDGLVFASLVLAIVQVAVGGGVVW